MLDRTSLSLQVAETAIICQRIKLPEAPNIVLVEQGWNSRVYVVNDGQYVFKFPRYQEVQERYQYELAVLEAVAQQENLAVHIPVVRWTIADNSYFGYSGVPGVELSVLLPTLSQKEKQQLGHQLGNFLRLLHQQQISLPTRTVADEILHYQKKYQQVQTVLQQHTDRKMMKQIDDFFARGLSAQLSVGDAHYCVCHADLGSWNIFVHEGRLGIIDFGEAKYCDESVDFMAFGDDAIRDSAFASYGASPELSAKTIVRTKAFTTTDIHFFIVQQDEVGFRQRLQKIQQLFGCDEMKE